MPAQPRFRVVLQHDGYFIEATSPDGKSEVLLGSSLPRPLQCGNRFARAHDERTRSWTHYHAAKFGSRRV